MGDIEFGRCDICHKDANLERTYFRYDIKCECHSPYHFELSRHCSTCVPKEPSETRIQMKTIKLNKLDSIANDIPIQPIVPLIRVIRPDCLTFCPNCGSTTSKSGFMGLFGKRLCHNKRCQNSK